VRTQFHGLRRNGTEHSVKPFPVQHNHRPYAWSRLHVIQRTTLKMGSSTRGDAIVASIFSSGRYLTITFVRFKMTKTFKAAPMRDSLPDRLMGLQRCCATARLHCGLPNSSASVISTKPQQTCPHPVDAASVQQPCARLVWEASHRVSTQTFLRLRIHRGAPVPVWHKKLVQEATVPLPAVVPAVTAESISSALLYLRRSLRCRKGEKRNQMSEIVLCSP